MLKTAKNIARPILKPILKPLLDRPQRHEHVCEFPHPYILTDRHGMRFVRHPWDRRRLDGVVSRDFYKDEFGGIERLVQPGDTVFDLGANVGVFTVYMSRLTGPEGRIFSFEPAPDTYWMMREAVVLNRCDNVTPLQMAVSDQCGQIQFNLFDIEYCQFNSLGKPVMQGFNGETVKPKSEISVPTITLDQFCQDRNIEHIDFLKVDVEGFEKHVFVGAERLLSQRRIGNLIFEISKDPLDGANSCAKEIFDELNKHGYHCYRFSSEQQAFDGPHENCTDFYQNYFASTVDLSQSQLKAAA